MENMLNIFPIFLLVLVRIVSFFIMIPIFSYRSVPIRFKIGLAAFLALILSLSMEAKPIEIDGLFLFLAIKEALVGLVLGLIGYIVMSAVQVAGGFIDFQMGFAIANVIDPQTGAQSPIIGQYLYIFALLFLLSIDGHHLLIDGIFHSYDFIPLEEPFLAFGEENTIILIMKTFAAMFMIAFQISLPIVASLFLVDVALGIVARTVPQMNVFVVGLPVKILVSFLLMFFVMGTMILAMKHIFELLLYSMRDFMFLLGQG
ncbi:flagellar biosynthetic protein FliR [Fervidibacillus halotolerans]|uniref:Flagellar biosynthetic protein FliR n=1 Tax=Fervidibacillus halotolerans TaxID=2980027 RepID=A0A9E8RZW7_9BACI|nr:flagellar biosynthetic protein FliR [Fervidibacillus halotolerans]WAA13589.1 flagellar biosynthetic protein FliR [Fervidibacillus halotolerans]